MRYSVAKAATMAEESYKPKNNKIGGKRIIASNSGHATAHLLSDHTLVIPGSNSAADYVQYNLRPNRFGHTRLTLNANMPNSNGSPLEWYQGFLAHTYAIQTWLTKIGKRPKFVIGHSLGAATTQVLSIVYGVPGIGFAAPRVCKSRPKAVHERRCLLIYRDDDIVARVPDKYHHLGTVKKLTTPRRLGPKHKMKEYIPLLPKHFSEKTLPKHWP